jgi:outer membrane protein TolC
LHASEFQDKDQRNAVIQDVALTYAELAKWEARLVRLQQDEVQAQQMEQAVAARLQQGVDSAVDLNKAKLTAARVRLHQAEARGNADVLRRHLSTLTGLPVSSIEIAPETIPALPPVAAEEDLSEKAIASSPAIKIAQQHSLAEAMRASGEHRSLLPSISLPSMRAFPLSITMPSTSRRALFNRTMPRSALPSRSRSSTPASALALMLPRPKPSRQKSKRRRLAIRWQRKR